MLGIKPRMVCHRLSIDFSVKPVTQRKHKVGEDNRESINKEVEKLKNTCFITKIKYLTWLANVA